MLTMSTENQIVMVSQDVESVKDKKTHIKEYIASIKAIEDAMEPYKEQKRDLKAEYVENSWLTKEDISMAVKAYRLLKSDVDLAELIDVYESLRGGK